MVEHFRRKYKDKSEAELRKIAASNQFQKEALVAAILELEDRKIEIGEFQPKLNEIQNDLEQTKMKINDDGLISKTVIFLVSFLLNPLFALVPYIVNLVTIKRYHFIWEVTGFVGLFTFVNFLVLAKLNWYFGAVIIFNILGTIILTELLWKRHFSNLEGNEG